MAEAGTQPETGTAVVADATRAVGPLFIAGRQHSGNTVTACIFELVSDCLAVNVEGRFFEDRQGVERIKDPHKRAAAVVELLRLRNDELEAETLRWLTEWHEAHPEADAIEVYRQAMTHATEAAGKRFWVRRATSYIFYAREILELMPEARVLYLLRNPYDVCASKKRRSPTRDRFIGWVVSWNRGLRIAGELARDFPDRFLMVRYEDMVTEPARTFERIFAFAGVPFDERYLDVPHVNRSEAHQTRTSATRGLNPSRVYYYTEILTPAEVAAVKMLAWNSKVGEHYPDLPAPARSGLGTRLGALGLLGVSPFAYLHQQVVALFRHNTAWRLRRMLKRLGIAFRSG
jgi:hypothetical protein